MKNVLKITAFMLISIMLFSSCNKDEEVNNSKIVDNEYYSNYLPSQFLTIEDGGGDFSNGKLETLGDFEFDTNNILKSVDITASQNEYIIGTLTIESTVSNDKISELLISFLDGEKHNYKYTHEGDKIVKVEMLKNSNYLNKKSSSALNLSPGNIFSQSKSTQILTDEFSSQLYYTLKYKGDKVEKLDFYSAGENEQLGSVNVYWEESNISKIELTDLTHPNQDFATTVYEFEYDKKPNLQKYMALNKYATTFVSELGIEANPFGLISYFSDNNLKKVIIDYPEAEVFTINVNAEYDGEIATSISMQYDDGSFLMSSTVDFTKIAN